MSFIAIQIDKREEGNQDKEESDSYRVCMESLEETSQLIKPCNCKGLIKFIHFRCLKEWIDHSHDDDICGICKTKYHGLVKTASDLSDEIKGKCALVIAFIIFSNLIVIQFPGWKEPRMIPEE